MRAPLSITLCIAGLVVLPGCGGKGGPGSPSGGSGCFAVVGNKGSVTASITGLSAYTGIVGTGASFYAAAAPPFFSFSATSVQDGTGVEVVAQALVGTNPIGPANLNTPSQVNTITVITRSCTAGTGTWVANIAFGSGTIMVTSVSPSAASGSFSATLLPGLGSSGNKTITGQFNVTF